MPDRRFKNIVAGSRGVIVDSEDGWSGPVAFDPEDCEEIAAEFVAMAEVLRSRPDILARWEALDA